MKSQLRTALRGNSRVYTLLATPYHFLRRALGLNVNEGVYLYFEQLGAAFIALPKNANSTINALIFEKLNVSYNKTNYQSIHDAKRPFSITRQELIALRRSKRPFTFAFARNPYERLVACWENKINEEEHDIQFHYGPLFKKGMSFEEFAEVVCMIPDRFSDIHFRSQHAFLFAGSLPLYDYLGRIESFDRDIQYVIKRLELASDVPTMNMSDTAAWKKHYNERLVEKVYERYEKDFQVFSYSRDSFRAR